MKLSQPLSILALLVVSTAAVALPQDDACAVFLLILLPPIKVNRRI